VRNWNEPTPDGVVNDVEMIIAVGVLAAFAVASYFLGVDSRGLADEQLTVERRPRRAI
jgi:hypothetical protein